MSEFDPRIRNPYPGLRPFHANEADLFFDRDEQIRAFLRRLRRTRFMAVVGTSGSGKSSLVKAGILPALKQGGTTGLDSEWRIAEFRPSGQPIRQMADALARALPMGDSEEAVIRQTIMATALRSSSLGLVRAVKESLPPAGENILVFVDQFEELFRFGASSPGRGVGDEAADFVQLLLEAAHQEEVPIYV